MYGLAIYIFSKIQQNMGLQCSEYLWQDDNFIWKVLIIEELKFSLFKSLFFSLLVFFSDFESDFLLWMSKIIYVNLMGYWKII